MKFLRRVFGKAYDIPVIQTILEFTLIILPAAFLIRTFFFGLYQVPTGSMETTLLVGERFFADKLSYWFRKPRRGEIIACNDPQFTYSTNPATRLWQQYGSWNVVNWTKRIIGIPGDRIQGKIERGRPVIYLNDEKLDEPYVNDYPLLRITKQWAPLLPQQQRGMERGKSAVLVSWDPKRPWDDQPFYYINPEQVILNPAGQPAEIRYPHTPCLEWPDTFDITLGPDEYWAMGDNRLGSYDSRGWGVLKGSRIHGRIIYRILSVDTDAYWWVFELLFHPIQFIKKIRWSRCFQWVT